MTSFPSDPEYKQKHTDAEGRDFYYIGDKWLQAGSFATSPNTLETSDPGPDDTREFGARWVNVESGEVFEFVSPGVWRRICQTPSIQIAFKQPTTQPDGAPLMDGDMWFDPTNISIGIYYNNKWYDVISSATTKTITVKTPTITK